MSDQWFYVQHGQRIGPVSLEQLRPLFASGALPPDTQVWHPDFTDWVSASTLPALAAVATSPALPPPARIALDAPEPFPAADSSAPTEPSSSVPPVAVELLKQTRPWVRLMGVLGAVHLALLVLSGLGLMALSASGRFGVLPVLLLGGFYLLLAGLMLPPVLALHRYASRITDLVRSGHHRALEAALEAQKGFWKYMGILALVGLTFSLLGGIAAAAVSLGRLSWMRP